MGALAFIGMICCMLVLRRTMARELILADHKRRRYEAYTRSHNFNRERQLEIGSLISLTMADLNGVPISRRRGESYLQARRKAVAAQCAREGFEYDPRLVV